MSEQQHDNQAGERNSVASSPGAEKAVTNPNPRANENIRVSTENAQQNTGTSEEVNSEITDGEDA